MMPKLATTVASSFNQLGAESVHRHVRITFIPEPLRSHEDILIKLRYTCSNVQYS